MCALFMLKLLLKTSVVCVAVDDNYVVATCDTNIDDVSTIVV